MKGRLKRLEQVTSDLNSRFETMDRTLSTPVASRGVVDHAKELEQSLTKWQKQAGLRAGGRIVMVSQKPYVMGEDIVVGANGEPSARRPKLPNCCYALGLARN